MNVGWAHAQPCGGGRPTIVTSRGFSVVPENIEHVKVCGSPETYCGHPRQGGIHYFGNGELVLIHNHAPCAYERPEDVRHDEHGYHAHAQVLLQRSLDYGRTWPQEHNVVLFDHTKPLAERRAFLYQGEGERPEIDMQRPESIVFFGFSWAGPASLTKARFPSGGPLGERDETDHEAVLFALRSADKGRTWESRPFVLEKPPFATWLWGFNQPPVVMPDGSLLAPFTTPQGVVLYGSDDDGLSWHFISTVAVDPYRYGRFTYAHLIILPSGKLQCYMYAMGSSYSLAVTESWDAYSWSAPRPIVRWGYSPWRQHRRPGQSSRAGATYYRSPWAMRLRDGRILVLFARRVVPYGIGGVLSEDDGETWSNEFILRCDASVGDIGYPVAVQFEDGRIFTAYYYTLPEPHQRFGGPRFIAGTYFTLP